MKRRLRDLCPDVRRMVRKGVAAFRGQRRRWWSTQMPDRDAIAIFVCSAKDYRTCITTPMKTVGVIDGYAIVSKPESWWFRISRDMARIPVRRWE